MEKISKTIKGVVIILIILSFIGGFYFGSIRNQDNFEGCVVKSGTLQNLKNIDMAPFWRAWSVIENSFVPISTTTQVTSQEKVWGAIQGLATSVEDPYTIFLPPKDNKMFNENISGDFEGVGMRIGKKDDFITVISPLKNTPAEKAGIKSGDVILKIDDKNAVDITLDEAVKSIRGEKGTQVILTIKREEVAQPIKKEVTRDKIQIPTIDSYQREDGVFVIHLFSFNENSTQLFKSALKEFKKSNTTNLVLDLRGNPGGYLQSAVDIASWFLPQGKVVVIEKGAKDESSKIYKSKGYNIFNKDLDLVVLVDKGSASASEILAGALHDHKKATLIGEQTFGKGSVQKMVKITDKTSFKVTIARWLTPNGNCISKSGLKPDIEVEITKEDLEGEKKPQMERAAEFLKAN